MRAMAARAGAETSAPACAMDTARRATQNCGKVSAPASRASASAHTARRVPCGRPLRRRKATPAAAVSVPVGGLPPAVGGEEPVAAAHREAHSAASSAEAGCHEGGAAMVGVGGLVG